MKQRLNHKQQQLPQQQHQRQQQTSEMGAHTRSDSPTDPFISMNERPVDDISLEFFYKPHTVTLLAVSIISVMYFAFVR